MKTVKGYTDSINECDCCGKTNLKGTFLLVDEFNNEFYYGSTCAKNKHGGDEKKMRNETSKYDNMIACVNRFIRVHKLGDISESRREELKAFCTENGGFRGLNAETFIFTTN